MAGTRSLTERARTEPGTVRQACEAALLQHDADRQLPVDEQAETLFALGWATFTQGDIAAATSAIARIASLLQHHPQANIDQVEVARLDAAILVEQGRYTTAEQRLTEALPGAAAGTRARLWSALGGAQSALGNFESAIDSYAEGLAEAQAESDRTLERVLRNNRATAYLEMGRFELAAEDLAAVRTERCEEEDPYLYALTLHNTGVGLARHGRLPEAVSLFDEASDRLKQAGDLVSLAYALTDQSRLFLDAGLFDEASTATDLALSFFEQLDSPQRVVEVLRLKCRIHTAHQEWRAAIDCAERAAEHAHERALADDLCAETAGLVASVEIMAALASPDGRAIGTDQLVATPVLGAPDLAVDAGLLATRAGHLDHARRFLETALSSDATNSSLLDLHHAVAAASIAVLDGSPETALARVDEGLSAARDRADTMGVSELRTMTERRAEQLTDIALRIHVEQQDASAAIASLERGREIALLSEPDLAESELEVISQLRAVHNALQQRPLAAPDKVSLIQRRAGLEEALTAARRSRTIPAAAGSDQPDEHHDGAIVSFVVDDELFATQIDRSGSKIIAVGPAGPIDRTIRALRMTLSALAGRTPGPQVERLVASLRKRLGPMLQLMDQQEQVLFVPSPALEQIPWALLTDAPVAQAPSLALTGESVGNGSPVAETATTAMVAIAGPDLQCASEEAQAVASCYPNAAVLDTTMATAGNVLSSLPEADTLHFATHGHFRADNPLYSSLTLTDGPFTLLDLLAARAPRRLVFSACDVGRSAAGSSIGLASLLLNRGSRAVIASSGLTNDESALPLMVATHEGLARGDSMAKALRSAQSQLIASSPDVALFAAFGAG